MECSICCNDIDDKDVCTTCCNHKYHHSCIMTWIRQQTSSTEDEIATCPICRSVISIFGYMFKTNWFNNSFLYEYDLASEDDEEDNCGLDFSGYDA